jgi:hypothetical protein
MVSATVWRRHWSAVRAEEVGESPTLRGKARHGVGGGTPCPVLCKHGVAGSIPVRSTFRNTKSPQQSDLYNSPLY